MASKLTDKEREEYLREIKEIAKSRGGECLSTELESPSSKLRFRCNCGYEWDAKATRMKYERTWCIKCRNGGSPRERATRLEEMKQLAAARGGQCLSSEYLNSQTKLRFKCKCGHEWSTTPNKIKTEKTWCPICSRRTLTREEKETALAELRAIATSRGGECLDSDYVNSITPLRFRCAQGHEWAGIPLYVKRGTWCKRCGLKAAWKDRKTNIEKLQRYAREKGGKLVSTEYIDAKEKLVWKCEENHSWEASADSVLRSKSWCPRCAGNYRLSIETLQAEARSRGGELLSKEYVRSQALLEWQCGNGHKWQARAADIRQGKWCPECCASFGERLCRVHFEALFQAPFPKTRSLGWLTAPSGRRLELDGYNADLKLAFEHQGQQHYRHVGGRYRTKLGVIRKRDNIKRKLCRKHGVTLIEIPEVGTLTKLSELRAKIAKRCERAGVSMRQDWQTLHIDLKPAYLPHQRDYISEFQELAKAQGGLLLSEAFSGWNDKLLWKCAETAHPPFASLPSSVMNGTWCPKCAQTRNAARCRDSIETFITLAHERGGECLSDTYTNSNSVLEFRCKEGHIFRAKAGSVKHSDVWCRTCSPREWIGPPSEPIETFQRIAESHGGSCLSLSRPKGPHKLEFECSNGHVFLLDPNAVKNGTWCRKCAAARNAARTRGSIETFIKIAQDRNGECLSTSYVNNMTKLDFRCAEGHLFSSKPVDVKGKGSWCPICAAKKRGEQRRIANQLKRQIS